MGVPGSGKTALANTLKNALNDPLEIIDDYAPEIERELDLALGFNGTYIGNLHVALERAARERRAQSKTIITCGTLLETATYMTLAGVAQLGLEDEAEQQDTLKRIEGAMRVFACLYMDTFIYDHTFYLPPLNTDGDERLGQLDMNLQVAFAAFNVVKVTPLTPLLLSDDGIIAITAKRCEEALKVIGETG